MQAPQQDKRATFVFIQLPNGKYAATTRANDGSEPGRIGLPGGKVDPGESLTQAAMRECAEEGWMIEEIEETPFFSLIVDGFQVFHYVGRNPTKLGSFKEKGRIHQIEVSLEDIAASGFGNEKAVVAFQRHMGF